MGDHEYDEYSFLDYPDTYDRPSYSPRDFDQYLSLYLKEISMVAPRSSSVVNYPPGEPAPKTTRQLIDEEVREAIEAPLKEAEEKSRVEEVTRRVEMIKKLGNDEYPFGAVLTWTRRFGEDSEFTQSKEYTYAALKAGDGRWYVTGSGMSRTSGWKWHELVEWMFTGDNTIENLMVVTAWKPVL